MVCAAVGCSSLKSSALKIVCFQFYGFSSVQIQSETEFAAVEISDVFVCFALHIRTLSSCKMLLYKVKYFSAYNGFVCIFKDTHIFRFIFDPLFQLIGF